MKISYHVKPEQNKSLLLSLTTLLYILTPHTECIFLMNIFKVETGNLNKEFKCSSNYFLKDWTQMHFIKSLCDSEHFEMFYLNTHLTTHVDFPD